MYNFTVTNLDTDSISICKPDGAAFSKEEKLSLLDNLNSIFDEEIKFADDGYFPVFIVLKAKNYIMKTEEGKLKFKGSSLKSSTLEPKLKEMLGKMILELVESRTENLVSIYHSYIKEASLITDIKLWAKKLTLSEVTFKSERANEQKVVTAIQGTDYKEGDKVFLYFRQDTTLALAEHFKNDYDVDVFYEKIFKTTKRFETILDVKTMFPNYSLKKNKKALDALLISS